MDKLDDRKEKILAFIITSYVEDALPVGSKTLSERLKLRLSSSTLRNEMGYLEEMGYVTHPHTSAGRIPTEKAIEYGKLAVQTGMFPLYEVVDGEYHITMDFKKRKPMTDYFKGHGRFRHLTTDQVQQIQERVDAEWERLRAKCVNIKAQTNAD